MNDDLSHDAGPLGGLLCVFLAPHGKSFSVGIGSVSGFLLDENLPYRLRFTPSHPVHHSSDVGLNPSDSDLWDFAQERDLVIVTKDSDFSDRILVSSPPPRIIHLRFGNLEKVWPRLEVLSKSRKLINVYLDRIETVT